MVECLIWKFETCQGHCVVSLSKTLYPLLSTGLTHKDGKTSPTWLNNCWLRGKASRFACSKDYSVYPQHMFLFGNKTIIFNYSHLSGNYTYGKCSKISNTSCVPKRLRQTVQIQIRRSSLIRIFPVCFSDNHSWKLTFYLRTEREKCSKFYKIYHYTGL